MIERIVSGGQTGVDRAALDSALERGISCGGWCPKGRKAEDGSIPSRYPLQETPSPEYEERTRWNVRDSDGTLVLTIGAPMGGTAYTIACAREGGKPCLCVDLEQLHSLEEARRWLAAQGIRTLNVAGPRESQRPGIYAQARAFLEALLAAGECQRCGLA